MTQAIYTLRRSQQRPSSKRAAIEHVSQHAGDVRDVVRYRKLTILARHPAGNDSFGAPLVE